MVGSFLADKLMTTFVPVLSETFPTIDTLKIPYLEMNRVVVRSEGKLVSVDLATESTHGSSTVQR